MYLALPTLLSALISLLIAFPSHTFQIKGTRLRLTLTTARFSSSFPHLLHSSLNASSLPILLFWSSLSFPTTSLFSLPYLIPTPPPLSFSAALFHFFLSVLHIPWVNCYLTQHSSFLCSSSSSTSFFSISLRSFVLKAFSFYKITFLLLTSSSFLFTTYSFSSTLKPLLLFPPSFPALDLVFTHPLPPLDLPLHSLRMLWPFKSHCHLLTSTNVHHSPLPFPWPRALHPPPSDILVVDLHPPCACH